MKNEYITVQCFDGIERSGIKGAFYQRVQISGYYTKGCFDRINQKK